MGLGFVIGVGWFMPKFLPVRNGRQVISDKSLEGIKREHFLYSGAENIILPKTLETQKHLPLPPQGKRDDGLLYIHSSRTPKGVMAARNESAMTGSLVKVRRNVYIKAV